MALVQTCDRCGYAKIIDTHCSQDGMVCFDCLTHSVEHKSDCPTVINARIERNKHLAKIHDLVAEKQRSVSKDRDELVALVFFLRRVDPCHNCHGAGCSRCDGLGYNPRPSEADLAEKMPRPTY